MLTLFNNCRRKTLVKEITSFNPIDRRRGDLRMMFVNPTWFYPAIAPVAMPIGLNHLDSDFCWCDPAVDVDENGEEVVHHRRVTWS